jgi:hypothetical protein
MPYDAAALATIIRTALSAFALIFLVQAVLLPGARSLSDCSRRARTTLAPPSRLPHRTRSTRSARGRRSTARSWRRTPRKPTRGG